MFKFLFKLFAVVLVISVGVGIYLLQYPEYRLQAKIFQRSIKIQAAISKLIADHTCSDELKKVECYDNFVRVTGGIEFSSDLAVYQVGQSKICYGNTYCMMAMNEKLISQISAQSLWVVGEIPEDPAFFNEAFILEKSLINRYLREIRKTATESFMGEKDLDRKNDILNYIKTIDSKFIELSKSK